MRGDWDSPAGGTHVVVGERVVSPLCRSADLVHAVAIRHEGGVERDERHPVIVREPLHAGDCRILRGVDGGAKPERPVA